MEAPNRMEPELEQLYHDLDKDLDWLWRTWGEFRELFTKGPDRFELMNFVASNFFYFLHRLMFEDMMLHLSRLTDPPETFGRTNLTLRRMVKLIDGTADPSFKASLQRATDRVLQACQFARTWRDKCIAHTDLPTFRKEQVSPLPARVQDLEGAMQAIREFMKCVEQNYGIQPSFSMPDHWGAKSLMHFLEVVVKAKKEDVSCSFEPKKN
jgi:hypothetical protein